MIQPPPIQANKLCHHPSVRGQETGATNACDNSPDPPSTSRTQSSFHGCLSMGMVSNVPAWHGSPAILGPLLGDSWHIANLFMTHQTIYSDFCNSITRSFGSQMGKRIIACCWPEKQPCPNNPSLVKTLASPPAAFQTRAAMFPGQGDAGWLACRWQ